MILYALPWTELYIILILDYTFALYVHMYMHGCTLEHTHLINKIKQMFQTTGIVQELHSLKKSQMSFLKSSFKKNAYPSVNSRKTIAQQLGLSEQKVTWLVQKSKIPSETRKGTRYMYHYCWWSRFNWVFTYKFLVQNGQVNNSCALHYLTNNSLQVYQLSSPLLQTHS